MTPKSFVVRHTRYGAFLATPNVSMYPSGRFVHSVFTEVLHISRAKVWIPIQPTADPSLLCCQTIAVHSRRAFDFFGVFLFAMFFIGHDVISQCIWIRILFSNSLRYQNPYLADIIHSPNLSISVRNLSNPSQSDWPV